MQYLQIQGLCNEPSAIQCGRERGRAQHVPCALGLVQRGREPFPLRSVAVRNLSYVIHLLEKTLMLEGLRAGGEGDDRG